MMWFARRSSALSLRANKLSEISTSLTPAVRRFQGGEVPLVRIDLIKGKSQDYRTKVGDIVYQTLIDVLNVPQHDRFHVITEHSKSGQPFDRQYAGILRSDDCIFFQITLNSGRSVELKQSFYKALAERLNEGVGLRKEDTSSISSKFRRKTGRSEMVSSICLSHSLITEYPLHSRHKGLLCIRRTNPTLSPVLAPQSRNSLAF